MIISYTLSLFSKEASLIFPALLLLYHYTFKEKIRTKEFLTISGMMCAYLILRNLILRIGTQSELFNGTTLFQRLPGFFVAITNYVRLLFLPIGLHVEYGDTLFSLSSPKVILGIIILASIIFFAVKTAKTNRLVFFSLSWFCVSLLPVSNLYPINAYMSENWLYLPSIGFFVIVAHGLCQVLRMLNKKYLAHKLAIIILALLIAFYSFLAIKQNNYWKNPITFYERTLKYAPHSPKITYNLANEYRGVNKYKAIEFYKKAIKLAPNFAESYNNLGLTYLELNKKADAIKFFNKSIEINPKNANAYYNLANMKANNGEYNEAIKLYKKAIDINPYHIESYNNLATIYGSTGREEEAVALWKKIIELDPNSAMSHLNLSRLYREMGMREEASSHFDKALLLQGK